MVLCVRVLAPTEGLDGTTLVGGVLHTCRVHGLRCTWPECLGPSRATLSAPMDVPCHLRAVLHRGGASGATACEDGDAGERRRGTSMKGSRFIQGGLLIHGVDRTFHVRKTS
jgi:hypothetical protein